MQVNDGPCVMYVGDGGAGNYVKMVHNGIEYGDMQVSRGNEGCFFSDTRCDASEGLTNEELAATFPPRP